jgi:hypothetical protein
VTPLILSPDELQALTGGRVQRSAQRRELDFLGIPYKLRRDGSLVVFRAAAEHAALPGVAIATAAAPESTFTVDLDAMRARRKHGKTATA